MDRLYTLGEVSKITGIEKRTLKYYVERKIITPSHKKIEGGKEYWLYSDADILKIRQIALYRELGYSADNIRKMISTPDFDWRKVLDDQIAELKKKKRHFENLIFAAEMMRCVEDSEAAPVAFDISDFDNDIDRFAVSTFSGDGEELIPQSLEKIEKDLVEDINWAESFKQGRLLFDKLSAIKNAMSYSPDSTEMQESLADFLDCFGPMLPQEFHDVLFGYRFISNLSIDRIIDILFSHEGATEYFSKALEKYNDDLKRRKSGG